MNDTWLVGGAVSWTTGDGSFSNGSSDMGGWSAAAYLSGFFENGAYVDVVGRTGRLSTDISASSGSSVFTAHYANTTLGASVEAGWRQNLSKSVFVEPQAEFVYGFVQGDAFTGANGVSVDQNDFETLVGRLGVRVGKTFAHHVGSVYAHASWNREFRGEADYTARLGDVVRREGVDLGGSWLSMGVGGQLNHSMHLALYGSLERYGGSDYDEDYRYTVGVRCTD